MNPARSSRHEDGRSRRCSASGPVTHAAARRPGARLVGVGRDARSGGRHAHGARHRRRSGAAASARPSRCATTTATAASSTPARCARAIAPPRDEQHLTRGRANTLRLALSGQLGPDALASDAVRDAMELCVSCKGCRRECPTGVDMARMKIEFRHQWQRAHGLSFAERLIAYLPRWAPWAARVAVARQPARHASRRGARSAKGCSASRRGARLPRGGATRSCAIRPPSRREQPERTPTSCCSSTRSPTTSSPRTRARRWRCWQAAGYRVHVARAGATMPRRTAAVLRPHLPHRGSGRRGESRGAPRRGRARAVRRARRRHRRARAVVPAVAARRVPGDGPRRRRMPSRRARVPDRGIPRRASTAPAASTCRSRRCRRRARWCTAIVTRRRSTRCRAVREVLELVPGLAGRDGRIELLRHGRQLRLRGRALRRLACGWRSCRCCPRCARRARTR